MPSDLPLTCQERLRLLGEFADAADDYSVRVREMADLVTSGEEVRANEARRNCRAAWDVAEKNRLALYRHEADHNCLRTADLRNLTET